MCLYGHACPHTYDYHMKRAEQQHTHTRNFIIFVSEQAFRARHTTRQRGITGIWKSVPLQCNECRLKFFFGLRWRQSELAVPVGWVLLWLFVIATFCVMRTLTVLSRTNSFVIVSICFWLSLVIEAKRKYMNTWHPKLHANWWKCASKLVDWHTCNWAVVATRNFTVGMGKMRVLCKDSNQRFSTIFPLVW